MRRVRSTRCLFACLSAAAVAATLSQTAVAAPHPRDVGDGVIRLRSTTFLGLWGYDDNAVRVEEREPFTAETVGLMVEAGLAPRLTLHGTLPFVFIPNSATQTPSTGDATVGGLLAILDDDIGGDPLSLALSLDLKLPLYDGSLGPTARGRAPDGRPAVGDGQIDVTAGGVLVSRLPMGGAMDLYLAYRMRTGGITDAVVGGGRIGMWFLDKWFFASAYVDTVITMVPDADALHPSDDVVGRGYATVGGRLSVRIVDGLFADLGVGYVGRGTNAPGGVDLMFGASAGF